MKLFIAFIMFFVLFSASSEAHYYDGCTKDKCKSHVIAPYQAQLKKMAKCESHRTWNLNTGNTFYGGLQFALGTWHSVGGQTYPHYWPAREQKYRAVILYHRINCWRCTAGWPNCG